MAVLESRSGLPFGESGGGFLAPSEAVHGGAVALAELQAAVGQVESLFKGRVGSGADVLPGVRQEGVAVGRQQDVFLPAVDQGGFVALVELIPHAPALQVEGLVGGVVEFDVFGVVVALDPGQYLADDGMVGPVGGRRGLRGLRRGGGGSGGCRRRGSAGCQEKGEEEGEFFHGVVR